MSGHLPVVRQRRERAKNHCPSRLFTGATLTCCERAALRWRDLASTLAPQIPGLTRGPPRVYVDLGSVNNAFVGLGAFAPLSIRSHITENILRAGINYHFGGPVVARY
jgi:hypothetical protein